MTLYRVSGLVFLDCELCDGGDGVVVTVLAQPLALEVIMRHGVSTNPAQK